MRIGRYLTVVVVVTMLLLVYVHQQVANIQMSYSLSTAETKLTDAINNNKELKFKLAMLTSPAYLEEQLAQADINLVLPREICIVRTPFSPVDLPTNQNVVAPSQKSILQLLGFEGEAQAELTR